MTLLLLFIAIFSIPFIGIGMGRLIVRRVK